MHTNGLIQTQDYIFQIGSHKGSKTISYYETPKISISIKFRNAIPHKIIEIIKPNLIISEGLDYLPLNLPQFSIDNTNKIIFTDSASQNFIVFYDGKLAFNNKIFQGQFQSMVCEKTSEGLFIGQKLSEKKSGFGFYKTDDSEYTGFFEDDHFSGEGKLILTKTKAKYKGYFKQEGEVINKQGTTQKLPKPPNAKKFSIEKGLKFNRLLLGDDNIIPLVDSWKIYEKHIEYIFNYLIHTRKMSVEKVNTKFPNGEVYKGQVKDNKIHGFGKYFYLDGAVYVGQFENNLKHGIGTLLCGKQKIVAGQWKEDKLHGKARVYQKGLVLNCSFKNGILNSIISTVQH